MDFHDNDHVYSIVPTCFGIADKYRQYLVEVELHKTDPDKYAEPEEFKPVIFHLKGISKPARDTAMIEQRGFLADYSKEKAAKLTAESSSDLVAKHFVGVDNLICGGIKIESYKQLCELAPSPFADFVGGMVHSPELLTEMELKN